MTDRHPLTEKVKDRLRADRPREAAELLEGWLADHDDDRAALAMLAVVRRAEGKLVAAFEARRRLVELDPQDAAAWAELGQIQEACGRHADALRSVLTATRLAPDDTGLQRQLGRVLLAQGQAAQAERVFEAILALQPDDAETQAALAAALEQRGETDRALEILGPRIEAGERDPATALPFARACRRRGRAAEAIPVLRDVLRTHPSPLTGHELGNLHESAGDHDAAFEAHRKANEALGATHDPRAHASHIDGLIAAFGAGSFGGLPRAADDSPRPLLIVGMPRSGTSLAEQILAAHPRVHGAGELPAMPALVQQLERALGIPYPAFLPRLTPDLATASGSAYLGHLAKLAPDSARVVDKLPHNFLFLGLAALLLPGARVVHCARDPLDTCLSCYFQSFRETHAWSTDLTWLGRYYRDYRRLMDHWREVLPLPILDLEYERLVTDPEPAIRELLEFCGLEWDPACLTHADTRREVRTASYAQASQPIYTSSVGRAERYREHLGALVEGMGTYVTK